MRQPLGQHFLKDPQVVRAILAAADLQKTDIALEIGPGKAILTEPLAARVARLVAVELDRELASQLKKRFQMQPKIEIVQQDFLKADLAELFPMANGNVGPAPGAAYSACVPAEYGPSQSEIRKGPGNDVRKIKVLGNLPYSITAPIFEKLLAWPGWETGVFLVQREVAQRLGAAHGSKAFGILSLAVQVFADVETMLSVPPGAFAPPPEVHSCVIRIKRRKDAALPAADLPAFFDFAHAAFSHRRKTLANSLEMATEIPKKQLTEWLLSQQLNPSMRAEAIALTDYVRIAHPWGIFRRETELTPRAPTSTITKLF